MQTIYFSSARNRALEELERPRKGAWISLVAPTPKELEAFAKDYKLDIDLLNDAIDLYEAPRVEIDEGKVYIYTRYCYPEGQEVSTEPLLIIYTDDHLITISRLDTPIYKRLIDKGADILTTQKAKTLMQILNEINQSYRLQLIRIYKQILRIRAKLRQSDISNRDFVQIIEIEEDLNEFLAALQPQESVLSVLTKGRFVTLYEDDRDIIEDITLGTAELIVIAKSRLRTLTNIRQAYDAIATNNLNATFKRLTSIAIFMTIPTIVGGLWGMNVKVPFADYHYAFLFVLVLTTVLVLATIAFFQRKKWL